MSGSQLSESDKMTLMCRMIQGVSEAARGDSEQSVTTHVSRPMWRLWCEVTGMDPESEPTDWHGINETRRVFGSKTVVIEAEGFFAVSFRRGVR